MSHKFYNPLTENDSEGDARLACVRAALNNDRDAISEVCAALRLSLDFMACVLTEYPDSDEMTMADIERVTSVTGFTPANFTRLSKLTIEMITRTAN